MRASYAEELIALSTTYDWCVAADVTRLREQIDAAASGGLVAVGSGGSFSAAYFAAELHQAHTNHLSRALTPLQAVAAQSALRSNNVLLLSARGKNADIVGAARVIAEAEPRHLVAMTLRTQSPLASVLAKYAYAERVNFALPRERDGFLSTNSLLAFLVLTYRSYCDNFRLPMTLPQTYAELVRDLHITGPLSSLRDRTVLALYGPETAAAAHDFESKMSEAALGPVLLSDHRNFAHGRHFWLAKRNASSAVVAFHSSTDVQLAETTLSLFPADVPVVRISAGGAGPLASIRGVIGAMRVVGDLASMLGVNISRPGVPDFGRRIFHSVAFKTLTSSPREVAIKRKVAVDRPQTEGAESWGEHYTHFIQALDTSHIRGIILDYDGTLCGVSDRYNGVADLASDLERLLASGTTIGIATGRGDSAASDLRLRLPKELWRRVIVGHYNGGVVRRLDEDIDLGTVEAAPALSDVATQLRSDPVLMRIANLRERPRQLTIRAHRLADVPSTWSRVSNVAFGNPAIAVVASSHSLDVIPREQSKLAVVTAVRETTGADLTEVLCIGDKGNWPGNDYELLQLPLSLSVDEVSAAHRTCWNLAPAGIRGPQATAITLRAMKKRPRSSALRMRLHYEA